MPVKLLTTSLLELLPAAQRVDYRDVVTSLVAARLAPAGDDITSIHGAIHKTDALQGLVRRPDYRLDGEHHLQFGYVEHAKNANGNDRGVSPTALTGSS